MRKLDDDESDLNVSLMIEISMFNKLVTAAFMPKIRKSGLTLPQVHVLMILFREKRPLTVSELIEFTISTSGNTDVVVNNLIKAGLVLKKKDKTDKRKRLVELTEAGLEKASKEYKDYMVSVVKVLSPSSTAQKQELFSEFKKLNKGIRENF
ncbi:MarR family winged helix-turn-helix transcriptional regulator [Shewanella youngdeokensis]|uniref:MarR family transcriptional regulator n=1 Tax=Shewanella youngdeokensis TaxID=2999068 RepID=A0ABZ0K3M3_9GAMM|nr:MarR family transcriptional regulator [Shewanella sp. DAU334]